MARTKYGERDELSFAGGPAKSATFQFIRHSDSEVPTRRLITIPPGSAWNTGLHWHEEYVESVRVVSGKAKISISGVSRDYGPEDGIVTFPKYVIHSFGRADEGISATSGAEDTVLEEWTDPEDGFKEVFFYNVLSELLECNGKPGLGDIIQLGTTIAYVDEYPAVVPGPFFVKSAFIHAGLTAASWVGWALGYKPWLEEYTPEHLWSIAQEKVSR